MTKKILVADDSEDQRILVKDMLSRVFDERKYEIEEHKDGSSLRDRIVTKGLGGVCLVVTDNTMPGVKGIDIIRQFSGRDKPPFILISGDGIRTEALQVGAYAYLDKPYKGQELMDNVMKAVKEYESR